MNIVKTTENYVELENDIVIGHIQGVSIYKDATFQNNYAKFINWVKVYRDVEIDLTASKDRAVELLTEDNVEEFEEWCEYNEVTPIGADANFY